MQKLIFGVQYVYGCDVSGDLAEFGTMSGQSAELLARAMVMTEQRFEHHIALSGLGQRNLWLFDSFQGLPPSIAEVDRESPHVQSGVWAPGTCQGISQEELLARCGQVLPLHRIHIYDGWFSETMPTIPESTRFCLIHVDCDLYSSTHDVLDSIFGRHLVSEGATIFFDDWDCNRASPGFGERLAWAECIKKYRIEYSDCGSYGFASHRFIVHEYV